MRGFDPRELLAESAADGLPPVASVELTPVALRARFDRIDSLHWAPEIITDHRPDSPALIRPAAVLVPIVVAAGDLAVLLTVRPSHLRDHSGQIAFPGGRVEPTDPDRIGTALREAHEEVGLGAEQIEVLGTLPPYRTGTGFDVTPVVGLIAGDPRLHLDPNEVAETFLVPLEFLMNPANHERRRAPAVNGTRAFFAMPWRDPACGVEYFIWGVTAAILRNLYQFLRH